MARLTKKYRNAFIIFQMIVKVSEKENGQVIETQVSLLCKPIYPGMITKSTRKIVGIFPSEIKYFQLISIPKSFEILKLLSIDHRFDV